MGDYMRETYYFYRRTIDPGDCLEYNEPKGIAIYKQPISKGFLLFAGTRSEFEKYMRNTKVPSRHYSKAI